MSTVTNLASDQVNATILAIGDELILGECVDTNSSWIASQLAAAGVMTIEHRSVRDDRQEISSAVGISVATAEREWEFARRWLGTKLTGTKKRRK